eukprot:COSAG01_NODE_4342_length_5118_cov_2.630205_1_plen_1459_part_00
MVMAQQQGLLLAALAAGSPPPLANTTTCLSKQGLPWAGVGTLFCCGGNVTHPATRPCSKLNQQCCAAGTHSSNGGAGTSPDAVLSQAALKSDDARAVTSTVFSPTESGYACFRIPSLVAVPAPAGDRLLAFAEARGQAGSVHRGCHDMSSHAIAMKSSSDWGTSWTPKVRLLGISPSWNPHTFPPQGSVHNPTAVWDEPRRQVVLHFVEGTDVFGVQNGTTWQLRSTDFGQSFLPRERVDINFPPRYRGIYPGPGAGIVLSSRKSKHPARLVFPAFVFQGPKSYPTLETTLLYYSDDGAKTFHLSASKYAHQRPNDQFDEAAVVERADGSLLLSVRGNYSIKNHTNHKRWPYRMQALSTDAGETFSEFHFATELPDPSCQASLLSLPAVPSGAPPSKPLLAFCNPANASSRQGLTLRTSSNGGETWDAGQLIWKLPSAYSSMALPTASRPREVVVAFEQYLTSQYDVELVHIGLAKVRLDRADTGRKGTGPVDTALKIDGGVGASGPPDHGVTALGCFIDCDADADPVHGGCGAKDDSHLLRSTAKMAGPAGPEQCAQACQSRGFGPGALFGISNGTRCLCDYAWNPQYLRWRHQAQNTSAKACNIPCAADQRSWCGGHAPDKLGRATISVYTASCPGRGLHHGDNLTFDSGAHIRQHNVHITNGSLMHGQGLKASFDAVQLNLQGRVVFTMAVNGLAQNYVTVKFWGSQAGLEVGSQLKTGPFVLDLLDPQANFTKSFSVEGTSAPELDNASPGASAALGPFRGRWQYSTIQLPRAWTDHRCQITIGLGAGQWKGYGKPYLAPARAIYAVYTHKNPHLQVFGSEQQGAPPSAPAPPAPQTPNASAVLDHNVQLGVQHILDAQAVAMNWSAVEAGVFPRCLFGAPSYKGFSCWVYNHDHTRFLLNTSACKTRYASLDDAGNLPWTWSMVILSLAYTSNEPWAIQWAKQPWLLRRIALALDVHVRMQGSNGGWRGQPGSDGTGVWIGGPHRKPATGHLGGWGATSVARTFIMVAQDLIANGLMTDTIDDDDNPLTPNITRASAYRTMFLQSRAFVSSGGQTMCPNQELGDSKAAWVTNNAIALLDKNSAWSEETVLSTIVRPTLGLSNISRKMFGNKSVPRGNWVTISPKGLSMEAGASMRGGYTPGYSDVLSALDDWAAWSQSSEPEVYAAIVGVIHKMVAAFANYRVLDDCSRIVAGGGHNMTSSTQIYRCLRNEGWIGWRWNTQPRGPSTPFAPHTAIVLREPLYQREVQLWLAQAGTSLGFSFASSLRLCAVDFVGSLQTAIRLADSVRALRALPKSDAWLPQEESHPDFAFSDNVARSIVAKVDGTHFFANLQWRHDFNGKRALPNGVCRVHMTENNGSIDRLATVACSPLPVDEVADSASVMTSSVHSLHYGPFAVGMNCDMYHERNWSIPPLVVGHRGCVDVSTGKVLLDALPSTMSMVPNETKVLYCRNSK